VIDGLNLRDAFGKTMIKDYKQENAEIVQLNEAKKLAA
jgi:hypothetical protein